MASSEIEQDWQRAETVLKDWLRRARESQHTHYEAARHCSNLHSYLSLPVVALNTVMATSAFASIQLQTGTEWKIAFGLASILAASLAAIQVNLKLSERGERHRRIAAGYGSLRRVIEETLVVPHVSRAAIPETLHRLRTSLDHLSQDSPDIPRKIWTRALKLAERDRLMSRHSDTEYDEKLLDRSDVKHPD